MERADSTISCAGGVAGEGDHMELPPGFRFHPTDEELITHYLSKKVLEATFFARAIGDVDLNKSEPWELPQKAKQGEKEWFFFCLRDRKYPTGLRTNRATGAGYWKATGKDKEIHRGKLLVGMKKTLVFYKGRAPRGEKMNWVMHEYRLEGNQSVSSLPGAGAKNEWVVCRVFKKNTAGTGNKAFGSANIESFSASTSSYFGEKPEGGRPLPLRPPNLPPLMDSHVSCFSNAEGGQKAHQPELSFSANIPCFNSAIHVVSPAIPSAVMSPLFFSNLLPLSSSIYAGTAEGDCGFMQLPEGDGFAGRQRSMVEGQMLSVSQATGLVTDMNLEISSDHETGKSSFVECLWSC